MNVADLIYTPIVYIFMSLMVITFVFIMIGFYYRAEIIISPMVGFMIGALSHKETYIDDNTEITEYTLQVALGILSVTVLWEQSG